MSPHPLKALVTRRELVKAGAAGAALAAVPAGRALAASGRAPATTGTAAPFSLALRTAPVLRPYRRDGRTDYYRMAMSEAPVQILPGAPTVMRTFAGSVPAPTILARSGRTVVVDQLNRLSVDTSVHLHGGHVPADSDGHPRFFLPPGGRRRYTYPNDQISSTLWYHDHSLSDDAENVYRGLAGAYLLRDSFEDRLPLPSGRYDVLLQLRDAKFADDNSLVYDINGFMDRPTNLVNGTPQPYFRVDARKYRFRLVNTSNERVYLLSLADDSPMVQIASDGGLLPAPASLTSVMFWPGERIELVVDFSRYAVGSSVVLENLAGFPGEDPQLMRFDVVRTAPDHSSVPEVLRPLPPAEEPTAARDFVLTFDLKTGEYLINGLPFDLDRIDLTTRLGSTEAWTVSNPLEGPPIPHSFHVHLDQFRVLDRDGKPPAAGESGLKDTVALQPGETVRLLVRTTDYRGLFLYHCHMMGHTQMGMMGQFETFT